ncbi:hypothetical protein M422DRAFT_274649 [Sphaerobolus stellatus SS14]|uniref:Uncharacterized protein n=1 Tax=Sphaerobolus stellatus (strain SS14) TaxID=990650 RepID=A0A0C9TRP1_SPHS4|nr:hypothetical protein M422DRAFT_274649 [Sphaerobolus stellatus SS14]
MSGMSPRMKELFSVPSNQVSGKMLEPGNNWAHDKAAAQAATQCIIAQTAMIDPAPGSETEERVRTMHSRVPGDRYSWAPLPWNISEDIPHHTCDEQGEYSQLRHRCEAHTVYARNTPETQVRDTSRTRLTRDVRVTERTHVNSTESTRLRRDMSPINTRCNPASVTTRDRPSLSTNRVIQGIPESIERSRHSITEPQSIDMNALREEIKQTISATIKEKLCSDAYSVTTVSQSMQALDSNAQYWSDLAEEKVNNLLHEEASEEALLEAAREARSIHFQLDQSSQLREAGLMPKQQVRFSANTGGNTSTPSRNYGPNPIIELHIPHSEVNAQFGRQSTPVLSINAQLDGAVIDMTSEYSGIQQMVRQALQNASLEEEPEKSFLAKAGVKMGTPPTYGGEHNLEKFENWVANLLRFMSMYNLLGPQASKVQLQLVGQCLTDEAQEWFYRQKWFMPTLSLNKVVVGYDCLMQGSMNVQQLHQQLTKLAKQMVELPDAEEVLGKGFTAEFSKIDELVEQAVIVDNAKCYTSGYNSNQSNVYTNKPATVDHKRVQQTTTLNRSSNADAGYSNQHRSGSNNFQNWSTPQSMSVGGGNVRNNNPTYSRNPVKPGQIRPNCPFPDKDRRIAGARIEEAILEEDEGQVEEFDDYDPHPEEQQELEDQPEEDDQQYHLDDEEYEMRSIDNDVVHVNAVIKASGYNDRHQLYGIRVSEAEPDLRVSAVIQTGKEQPVYDHRARKKVRPLPTRGKGNETISVFCKHNHVQMGKLSFPNRFGSLTPTETDENEDHLRQEKPKALPAPTLK